MNLKKGISADTICVEYTMNVIVAVANDYAIGNKGDLLIRISTDLRRFKALTDGNVVIMGYNTLLSLPGGKPLKNRINIVLYPDKLEIEGATVVGSIEAAVAEAKKYTDKEAFVIGGGSVYRQMLPYCDKAYLTKIDKSFDADTFFPDLDKSGEWNIINEEEQLFTDDGVPYRYVTYGRIK